MAEQRQSVVVVGNGYVGTVVAACLADIGHSVVGVEIQAEKRAMLNSGTAPFFEPGLNDVLERSTAAGRLEFTDDYGYALSTSDVVFLCVDTPPAPGVGGPNLERVTAAARSIGQHMTRPIVLVTKSTVPVGAGNWLESIIEAERDSSSLAVTVVANPEFLREGSAVDDFLHPDRIVLGGDTPAAIERVAEIYRPIIEQTLEGGDPMKRPSVVRTSRTTAEAIKYAANAFLATKISFINEMANIAELVGADITEISEALGLDHRISGAFLNAGVGWGGSCFGKDLAAISATAREYGYEPVLLDAVRTVNTFQRHNVVRKLQAHLRPLRGRRVALLGLAFKPLTDDTRDAPAITIAQSLEEKGAIVRAYDPMVKEIDGFPSLKTKPDPYTLVEGADAVVLVTEWPEFLDLDWQHIARLMRPGGVVLDGRNVLDKEAVRAAGLIYEGIGRNGKILREHR